MTKRGHQYRYHLETQFLHLHFHLPKRFTCAQIGLILLTARPADATE